LTAEEKKDQERKVTMLYRRVFNTPEGRDVLTDILNDLGFFSQQLKTEADMACHNAATNILAKYGVWRPEPASLLGITDKLSELSPMFEE
jgi:hypothetical protein